jgi:succinate-semialdehyde dehydrogenase/glutarate-semialdehyde dehydrogenase
LEKAEAAFNGWRQMGIDRRAALMKNAAEHLQMYKDSYAKLMAEEMGKPLAQGIKESEKCALVCEFYKNNAATFLAAEFIETDASKSYVTFEPLGIVLAVMPWNFPFWQVFRAAVPALMAGNVMVLKHATNVPGCAQAIEKIFLDSGFPEGVFTNLFVETEDVASLIEHPFVRAVTLTGSVTAGRAVASKAGECLKKTVLELGGSDPYIILADANIDQAANACAESRLINSGQSCIAAKRFIVVESVLEAFEEKFLQIMKSQRLGDPFEEGVTVGPMARHDLRDELHKQVIKSIDMGARLLLGGKIPDSKGAFYPPTVLTNVKKGMPAYEEELFGPVSAIISVKDENEAIRVSNNSRYGLGVAVFTSDIQKGERMASRFLEAGACFVNTHVKSDPRLPFGGIKESGYGRELSSFGIREFVNIKTVYVK